MKTAREKSGMSQFYYNQNLVFITKENRLFLLGVRLYPECFFFCLLQKIFNKQE